MQANGPEEPADARVRRRLRELRTEQVAERADIDISTLSRLEAGNPGPRRGLRRERR